VRSAAKRRGKREERIIMESLRVKVAPPHARPVPSEIFP